MFSNIRTNTHFTVTHWPNGTICQINCLRNRSRWANKRRACVCVSVAIFLHFLASSDRMCDDFIIGRLSRGLRCETYTQFIFPFRLHITKHKHNKWFCCMDRGNIFSVWVARANPHSVNVNIAAFRQRWCDSVCNVFGSIKMLEEWMLNGHHHHSTVAVIQALVATPLIMCAYKCLCSKVLTSCNMLVAFFRIVSTTRTLRGKGNHLVASHNKTKCRTLPFLSIVLAQPIDTTNSTFSSLPCNGVRVKQACHVVGVHFWFCLLVFRLLAVRKWLNANLIIRRAISCFIYSKQTANVESIYVYVVEWNI